MDEYIKKADLYKKVAELEQLAIQRYLDTQSNSPCYTRYATQVSERTRFKHFVADFPAIEMEATK